MPIAHPIDQGKQLTTEELITKIDEAFEEPPAAQLPATLIFPVVGSEGHVREDGVGISHLAMFNMVYAPQRRMELCIPYARRILRHAGCFEPDGQIDQNAIDLSVAAVGAKHYVLPRLVEVDDGLKLTLEVREPGKAGDVSTIEHTIEADDIATAPGLIARSVLKELDVELNEADFRELARVQVQYADDLVLLGTFFSTGDFGSPNNKLIKFNKRNPRCAAGWNLYVLDANPAGSVLERFAKANPKVDCDRLFVSATSRGKPSQAALLELLELAPNFRSDPLYHAALASISQHLSDPSVTSHLIGVWQAMNPEYVGCRTRGEFLIDWAWQARGGGWASEVSDEGWKRFADRLDQAQQELESAIAINPLGFEAHAGLITVAMAKGLDDEYANQHFERAIELCPRYSHAYRRQYQRLRPRWGGKVPDLLAFARRCLETGYWSDGIPQIGREAIMDVSQVPNDSATVRTAFRNPDLWETVKVFRESAQHSEIRGYDKYSRNLFAMWGAFGGHYVDVADTFELLEEQEVDRRVFKDDFTYPFVRDLVFSETRSGVDQFLSRFRLALDFGDFERAGEMLGELAEVEEEGVDQFVQRYTRVIDIGTKLQTDKSIELSGQEMLDIFEGVEPNWSVWNGKLACRMPAGTESLILLPFGIQGAEVTGTIRWVEAPHRIRVHAHTRSLRDNVHISYYPRAKELALRRGNESIERADDDSGKASFRMVLTDREDQFEPTPEVTWTAPVHEYFPSGIGFQIRAKNDSAFVFIDNLQIRLLD